MSSRDDLLLRKRRPELVYKASMPLPVNVHLYVIDQDNVTAFRVNRLAEIADERGYLLLACGHALEVYLGLALSDHHVGELPDAVLFHKASQFTFVTIH